MEADPKKNYTQSYDHSSGNESDRGKPLSLDQKSLWAKTCGTWVFEAGGFVVGFLSIAATVALLYYYNNKIAPDWTITLNFILSIIGNIGFATTLFGINAAIAQYKWILFTKGARPLSDLGIFQSAHGSSIGAFELLYTFGTHFTIITGTLAVILGMVWSPFTQNLLHYETRPIIASGGVALVARNVYYRARGPSTASFRSYSVDPMLQLNMLSSITTSPNPDINVPDFVCSTGNCTWPPAATLGFCSQCTDISSQIALQCKDLDLSSSRSYGPKITQECMVTIPSSNATVWSESAYEVNERFMDVKQVNGTTLIYHSLRRVSGATMAGQPLRKREDRPYVTKADFSATECWLRPCVRSFQASVNNGVYTEKLLDTYVPEPVQDWRKPIQPPWGEDKGVYERTGGTNLSTFSLYPPQEELNGQGAVGFLEYDRLLKTFVGRVGTADGHDALEVLLDSQGINPNDIRDSMLKAVFFNKFNASDCGSPNDDTFACVIDALAQGITKTIRNSGANTGGLTAVGEEDAVRGTVYSSVTFVRVEWVWIALPATVWALGVLTWAIIAFQTRRLRLPAWKDNVLPLLFLYNRASSHNAGNAEREVLLGAERHPEDDELLRADRQSNWAYETVTEKITVQLRGTGGEPAVVGGDSARPIRVEPVKKSS